GRRGTGEAGRTQCPPLALSPAFLLHSESSLTREMSIDQPELRLSHAAWDTVAIACFIPQVRPVVHHHRITLIRSISACTWARLSHSVDHSCLLQLLNRR
ncbi:hypothetical protein PENTCL1PPCAC_8047, partial [Pristionchus entomophagus]